MAQRSSRESQRNKDAPKASMEHSKKLRDGLSYHHKNNAQISYEKGKGICPNMTNSTPTFLENTSKKSLVDKISLSMS